MSANIREIGPKWSRDCGSSTFDFTDDLSKKQLASRVETPPTGLGMTNVRPATHAFLRPTQIVAAVEYAFGPIFGAAFLTV